MKRFYVTALIIGAVSAGILLASCDSPVGLGSQISMTGPVVRIAEPSPNRSVSETDPTVWALFNVSGTANDETRVTLMTVTLDYWNAEAQTLTRMGREWKWEDQWMARESADAPWRPYTEADYNPSDAAPGKPARPPSWALDRHNVSWSLPVFMSRMETGDYFINVSAWNSAGRHDSYSSAKLKIRYNNRSPWVKIINPILLNGRGAVAAPKPPSWDGYIFDPFNEPEETSLNLRYYTNSFRDLSYQIENTISQLTEFSFEITNEHNLDAPGENKAAYYGWQWDGDGPPPLRGIFGVPTGLYERAGGLIALSEAVKDSLAPDSVTPMQMVTRVKDATGLEEYKSKGWFLYLPDSDKPYADINFAYKVRKDAQPPDGAPELASMVRGTTNLNSAAYDDDGVGALRWTLYKLGDAGLEVEQTAATDLITFAGNKKEPWSFRAERSYGTGRFKIVVTAQDIYGVWGDEYHGYFTITSNATPTVMTPLASPSDLTATFWGDGYGNITIAGRAQIEDFDECDGVNHGVRVTEAAIAWIRPGRGVENNFRFSDPNDPGWDMISGGIDTYGNRVWKVEPAFVAATAGNKNENVQEEWAFTRTLNYFTLLGIGLNGVPFTDQQFRIRVTGGDSGEPRSSVHSFTARGDMANPVVEITEIVMEHDTTRTSYPFVSYGVLPSIARGDRIMLRGTFSDDSIGQWSSMGDDRHRRFLTVPEVTWDSETRQFKFDIESFTLDSPDGGSWETGWYAFEEHNTDPIVQLAASVTDIGGRVGTGNSVMVVETNDPVLVRISSDNDDGYYGDNKPTNPDDPASRYIDIFLEFSKPVAFFGAGQAPAYGNAPRLELNNGGEAFYHSGSGTYRIVFRYFVDGAVNPPLNTAAAGKGGGSSPTEAGNPEGRLNVANVNFNGFGESAWKSLNDVPVIFKKTGGRLSLCDPADIFSLAAQKRIIIDKRPPLITGVGSSASTARNHGAGSQIYIELSFNKDVQITGASGANTYLTLTGGNLDGAGVRAVYDHVKDARTVSFLYTVQDGHDTSEYGQFLGASQAVIGGAVKDAAANALAEYPAIPESPVFFNGIVVDTAPPAPPVIAGDVNSNTTYYDPPSFYIRGLEPGGGTVEYHLDYPTSGVPETGWNTYSGAVAGGQTGPITLDLNGVYRIAARQYDTATTPNRSQPSAVIGPVRVDQGALLERVRSSLADGAYAHGVAGKSVVTVDLEFRVPVTLAGSYSAGNLPPVGVANITLNTSGGSTNVARLSGAPANSRKWTFEYVIPQGAGTPANTFLDVTAADLDGIRINDQWGTRVNGPNGWIHLDAVPVESRFNSQKKMTVLAGRPHVVNPALGSGIVFTGTQLRLEFDRDIYRGRSTEKLVIRQITDGFKIPAVLTEDKYNDAFFSRADIFSEQGDVVNGAGFSNAAAWQAAGAALYERGSNGAAPQGANKLVSDTLVKRVLKYEHDPDSDSNLGAYTMPSLRTLFRAAEALSFIPHDREITIEGSTLTVNLSSTSPGRPLPVKGARYEWVFPNGFIQDTLGTANGTGQGGETSPTGRDTNLTSGTAHDGERVLFYSSAAEPPVIRIDKGSDIPAFNNSTANRQVLQPVTTTVKINSRTPNATVAYWLRQTTDSVPRIVARNFSFPFDENNLPNPLPNIAVNNDNTANDNTVMRPQSGTAGYTVPVGVDPIEWATYGQTWWQDMSSDWGAQRSYSPNFTIGSEYYSDGGMIINLRASSTAPGVTTNESDYGYEAAYRSVFVFVKQTYKWGSSADDYSPHGYSYSNMMVPLHGLRTIGTVSPYYDSGLDRIWIRGGDTLAGNSSIPDFPLSRDLTQSRKAGLLTPITVNKVITPNTSFTANDIPAVIEGGHSVNNKKEGNNFWFWITWKIEVPAFIDVLYGELPSDANDPYQTPRTTLRYTIGSIFSLSREFYPLFPGRTLTIEPSMTRLGAWETLDMQFGDAFTPPAKSD